MSPQLITPFTAMAVVSANTDQKTEWMIRVRHYMPGTLISVDQSTTAEGGAGREAYFVAAIIFLSFEL
jgi:hypothetical protein